MDKIEKIENTDRGNNSQFYKIEKILNFVNSELQIRFFSIISFFLEGIILFQK